MKIKSFTKWLMAVAVTGTLFMTKANATLVIDSTTNAVYHFTSASNPGASGIESALGITASQLGDLLYKANRVDSDNSFTDESGLLTSSYQTTTTSGTFPIVISYVGGTIADATYLLVKDGNLGSYLYDLDALGWNGIDNIEIYNIFYPDKTSITGVSHIEFYGGTTTTAVPEPSTIAAGALLILPLGVSAIRILRKQKQQTA